MTATGLKARPRRVCTARRGAEAAPVSSALATADSRKRSIIVSIHDVAPVTQASAAAILRELSDQGVAVCSLLVVPDYHRLGNSMNNAAFREWLHEAAAAGHEVVIHGYFHQRSRRDGESLRQQLTTRFYTAGEGEFFDASYDVALRLISQAKEEFEYAGFQPRGFIAPAWLLSAAGERAAAAAGMEYTTRLGSIRDFISGETFRSQSMVYSTRSAWRRVSSLIWNSALLRRLEAQPLMRLGIHPPDRTRPALWRQILRHVSEVTQRRTAVTYWKWVHEQRVRELAEA